MQPLLIFAQIIIMTDSRDIVAQLMEEVEREKRRRVEEVERLEEEVGVEKRRRAELEEELARLGGPVTETTPAAVPIGGYASQRLVDCKAAFCDRYVSREGSLSPETFMSIMTIAADQGASTSVGALTQSSGWGKSRFFFEVSQKFRCLYISMGDSASTYPKQTDNYVPLGRILGADGSDPDLVVSHLMNCLAQYLNRASEDAYIRALTNTEWFAYQLEEWNPGYDVKIVEKVLPPLSRADARTNLAAAISTFKGCYQVGCALILCDEAAALLKPFGTTGPPQFRLFRRAFTLMGITACFASTQSKVQNFAPALHRDESYKEYTLTRLEQPWMPSPFLAINPVDLRVDAVPYPLSLGDLHSARNLAQFGRPLWWSFARHMTSNDTDSTSVLLAIARDKLNFAHGEWAGVAAVMIVAAVKPTPSVELAENLVHSHMATLVHVSKNRELLYTEYASEPYLAEASCMYLQRSFGPALKQLIRALPDYVLYLLGSVV
ncbi:hypothetical protein GNI_089850 [Gregarina niphandrodes]|uniref:Uncharacterized protein n=1 Tax=Gregarina niphandrodes TaxID=110365 RepID=A0A023B5I9_GRENI|nr:hypothetical protein GNI_089850 [Gregarina niphandrodes]EZG60855.1 hypothetical protein GNI_089850 [Gregarina niphandrodes]|eukprot:XP_011130817.1 hypothetical protein GNI_089850 [Gregarina niphandrodes]